MLMHGAAILDFQAGVGEVLPTSGGVPVEISDWERTDTPLLFMLNSVSLLASAKPVLPSKAKFVSRNRGFRLTLTYF